ncbi:peptidyl-dipeptidase Dcp [Allocatelliglobosispora scoriae]|uniref:Peptidyl-dipeptidase Dcp n=1 Tax=Allocatelliglobosispora scoriae TaxID=643052 RepID=A0A841BNC5_9ACTN|nr:M3 family metallopeptidase [Allocatelliglobosispora scoriae]MBB5868310.1 peptidyl-dipeptidase Dcp [Allocatelliglobosispora scoriae]
MASADNPFFTPSDLPYQVPPFDRITEDHYLPAFAAGMAEQRAEIEAIATSADEPTFTNTLVAFEQSGQLLNRVSLAFFNVASADTNPRLQEIHAEVAPQLAAHTDAIYLDKRLFGRVKALHDARDSLGLDPESDWLLQRYHVQFVRAGAQLAEDDAQQLREYNSELATLYSSFNTRLLADTNDLAVVVTDPAELAGLSDDAVAAAAEGGRARGEDGAYALSLILPTAQPPLASLHSRELRERVYRASSARGSRGNDNDTGDLIRRIVTLRAQRARLLGYEHHAAYQIEDNTARTAEAAATMLAKLAPAAVANAAAELADLQELADHPIEPWDWAYYAERVRKQRYDLDESELRPYFELDRVLFDGVFFAATKLFGLTFTERHDLPVYHPEVRAFEVTNADGSPLGLFFGDFYTRPAKRGGAWMNSLVNQSRLLGTLPVVVNNLNINRPPAGEPTLLTLDEVKTLFHEFGHALHGLLSDVHFPGFAGTEVPSDFVEYPSQVNEMWLLWPEVLASYAVHHQTGEPLPQQVADRLLASAQFDQGYATTEYLASALLDLAWHTLTVEDLATPGLIDDIPAFEAAALERDGVAVAAVPPRYRTSYFAHIWSGASYSAGYYSYIWSEVLDADTVEWFKENGGLRRENGDRFRQTLLSRGGTADAMTFFHDLRGREPQIEPLLTRRGLDRS